MSSLFEALPVELLEFIFQHLANGELASLCRTCKSFFPTAQQYLYRSFPGPRRGPDQLRAFVLTLVKRPDLAALVTDLDLTLTDNAADRERWAEWQKAETQRREDPRITLPPPHEYIPGYLRPETVSWYEDGDVIIPAMKQMGFNFNDEFWKLSRNEDVIIPAMERRGPHFADGFWKLSRNEHGRWTLENRDLSAQCHDMPEQENHRIPIYYHANLLLALTPNIKSLRVDTDWTQAWDGPRLQRKTIDAVIDWQRFSAMGVFLPDLHHFEVVGRSQMIAKTFSVSRRRTGRGRDQNVERWIDPTDSHDVLLWDDGGHEKQRELMELGYGDLDFDVKVDGDHMNLAKIVQMASLRSLHCTSVQLLEGFPHSGLEHITSLRLTDCATDRLRAISKLVQSYVNLEDFEFRARGLRTSPGGNNMFALRLYKALQETSQPPLRRLVITFDPSLGEYDAPYFQTNYRDILSPTWPRSLSHLEELELDFDMMMDAALLEEEEDRRLRLSHSLPPSIRKLTIRRFPRDGEEDARIVYEETLRDPEVLPVEMLEQLVEDVPWSCPKLREIDIYIEQEDEDSPFGDGFIHDGDSDEDDDNDDDGDGHASDGDNEHDGNSGVLEAEEADAMDVEDEYIPRWRRKVTSWGEDAAKVQELVHSFADVGCELRIH